MRSPSVKAMWTCLLMLSCVLVTTAEIITVKQHENNDLASLLGFTRLVEPKDPSWTSSTSPCDWLGVQCSAKNIVVTIDFSYRSLQGSVNFTSLPENVEQLRLTNAMSGDVLSRVLFKGFQGQVDFSDFPPSLWYVDISGNQFDGVVRFPPGCCKALQKLFLHYNHFSELELGPFIPSLLDTLTLFGNKLVGNTTGLQLAHLAETKVVQLDLAWNLELRGPVDLTHLPPTLEVLNLYGNKFSGPLNLSALPASLARLGLEDNMFCGDGSILPSHVCRAIYLGNSSCQVNCTDDTFACGAC